MAEYIDREALRKILENWRDAHADVDDEQGCGLLEDVIWEVDAQPTADVAPVVRCKDCKYSRPLNKNEKERFVDGVIMCTSPKVSEYGITDVWDTHFCSYGERKDSDNAT